MASRLSRLIFLILLPGFFVAPSALAQQPTADLRKDIAFFRKKQTEFNDWLRRNRLDRVLRADSVAAGAKKVTLFIRPVYQGARVCDSIQCAWSLLEARNENLNGQAFHERLLHKWAFLAEVHQTQAEIVVRCHEPAHFLSKINYREGDFAVDGRNVRAAAVVQVSLPASLEGVNAGDNTTMIPDQRVNAVCAKARRYLVTHYKPKGTPILWRAKIDTSYSSYDEFVLEVTHLSDEICPDGYYEYHRIFVKGTQKGDDVELSWEFQGKYGSGILFPPRKNDYKDLETRYKNNLEEYQKRLFKQLLDYLRR